MKIIDVKTCVVDCYRTNWVFIKVITNEGIEGLGEATLEYKEMALLGAIEDLKRFLIGKNPLDIEYLYNEIYRNSYWRTGPVLMSALSGIEIALWDILGKHLKSPVYQLLGGKVRDRVKIYANGWFAGAKTPQEFAQKAKETIELGVKAIKWDPFGSAYMNIENEQLDTALECIGAVRDAVGSKVDILIEAHGRFNVPTAMKIARELEQFKPLFFEEPVPPDNICALAHVTQKSNVAIATGERVYTKYGFAELLENKAVNYIQPDVSHAGGIMELKKIAAMAEGFHIPFAPHNPSGPAANAATMQLGACVENFLILEIMLNDIIWRKDITNESLDFEDGYLLISDKPGIGIELNEEEALKRPYVPKDLRHYNGSLTDIRPEKALTDYYFNNIR